MSLDEQGVELTLLCLPCAGASATMYLRWRRLLPAWLQVQPVELPGRGSRLDEVPLRDANKLALLLADEWVDRLPPRYVLFGHSMGAMLAHRLAFVLQERGRPMPVGLVVSACPAPGMRDPARFVGMDQPAALIADLRRQGGTPEAVFASPELLQMTVELLAADYAMCADVWRKDCVDATALTVPIHAFAGRGDDIATGQMQAWHASTTAGFSLDWFDGGHFFVREQEAAFLQRLAAVLAFMTGIKPHVDEKTVLA